MKDALNKVNTSIVLKKTKRFIDKDGCYPVKLQVSYLQQQKFYSLAGERYTPDDFDLIIAPKSQNTATFKKKDIRDKFNTVQKRADDIINLLDEFTFEDFEKEFIGVRGKKSTIKQYFENKAVELESESKLGTATGYKATIKSLEKFDSNITFKKITPKYLKQYENWYVKEGKTSQTKHKKGKEAEKKGGSYTTVGIYMRNLRHIVNIAIKDRLIYNYPFGESKDKYQIPVSNNTKKALTLNDIALLINYKSDNEQEIKSLKYWLFSYLCNGMNMIDILNLKYSNIDNDTLKFIRIKTKDTTKHKKQIEVVLLPETLEIIEQLGNTDKEPNNYIFPVLTDGLTAIDQKKLVAQHIHTINKYMARIAKKVGIDAKPTTYYARHSYSTIIRDSGASTEFIAEQLGHQSTKVTQAYLDSFKKDTKEKFQKTLIPK